MLEGEDATDYDALLARICAAVNPRDIIDEMFVNDSVDLQWEVMRWHRLKTELMNARVLKALEDFLRSTLDYELYEEDAAEFLTETLLKNRKKDQTEEFIRQLAQRCAQSEPDAVDKVNALLDAAGEHMDPILDRAKADRAKKLAQGYARRERRAVKQVHELLDEAGRTMDSLTAEVLAQDLDNIERIDHLTTIAETRRNASLREIDRRRAVLGEALRTRVQEIEDGEFEEIETMPTKGKNAA